MAGTRPPRRERLTAALLALVAVSAVLGGATGVSLADDADHVERTGDTLTITLGDEHFDGEDRNATVSVEGGDSAAVSPDEEAGGEVTYTVNVADLGVPKTDLSNATVTIRPESGEVVTDQVDLRLLRFDDSADAELSGTTLEVPLNRSLGYADGDAVNVTFDGDASAVDGTITYDGDTAVLVATFDPAQLSLPLPDTAAIRATDDGEQMAVAFRSLVAEATDVDADDRTLVVRNRFLAPNTEYDVVLNATSTGAIYANAVETDGNGTFEVNDTALVNAEVVAVSVYRDGNVVFEEYPSALGSNEQVTATVESNGTAVSLDGKSFDAAEATVWLRNSTRVDRLSAPVENGSVKLGATDYRLDESGSYRLLVAGDEYVRATVPGNESNDTFHAPALDDGGTDGAANSDGSDGGPFGPIPDDSTSVAVLAAFVLLFAFVSVLGWKWTSGRSTPSSAASGAGAAGRTDDHPVAVRIEDAATGRPLDGTVVATAKNNFENGRQKTERADVSGGEAKLSLERGEWHLDVEANGIEKTETRRVTPGSNRVGFTFGPKRVAVTVADDDGHPLSDIAVTATPDEGQSETRRTDDSGEVTVPVALGATEVEVSADHEKYEGDSATVAFGDDTDAEASLALRRLTGDLEVTASVDGAPVEGLPVGVQAREEAVRELGGDPERTATGPDGTATFEDLLVGRYEIRMAVPGGGDAFSAQSKRVQVRDGRRVSERLDAAFDYRLDRDQRDRIDAIRRDADALDSATGRDVAIPRYYGSVLNALLDSVERVADEGHRFATADADPDAVVDALLDAAEGAVGLVEDAMTSKRNTDLFGACADMPDERVEWNGGFDAERLFELLAEDRTTQRQTVLERLRTVDDRIDGERTDLAVVSPAREPWEGIKEFVNSDRGDDPVRGAAVAFVAVGLLDAVDELFDHERLRERLERTVF